MKIISLLPIKNEGWILPIYLSAMEKVADEIIALDDSSTDNSVSLLQAAEAKIITLPAEYKLKEKIIDMSYRRKLLLEKGRERGGTHFIWLDADETFSSPFLKNGRELISKLKPGEKLSMRWVTLWKSPSMERTDGVWRNLYKDFIVCDDRSATFQSKFLSEDRTPGLNDRIVSLKPELGVVLHFQFASWERSQYKQAWYRSMELIKKERGVRRINNTYSITLDTTAVKVQPIPTEWLSGYPSLVGEADYKVYEDQIIKLFDLYGIKYFEGLDIWQIEALRKEFLRKEGREPRTKVFSPILKKLIDIKNELRN